ncbi:hypothetical protein GUJ93_ZPchr0008g11898 [Zizania palustris]|uniref:Uncharacterized protein n=1 Tax=Zizania palustris TaxID=103762 RepID=A0A8J5RW50_ZIZPA|nr:hypothetical protein GUJ93_ZPchr0008g11898 [Zizania palustris]
MRGGEEELEGGRTWNGTKENSSLRRRVARRWMECFLTPQLISASSRNNHQFTMIRNKNARTKKSMEEDATDNAVQFSLS